jgi:hypothetical protein
MTSVSPRVPIFLFTCIYFLRIAGTPACEKRYNNQLFILKVLSSEMDRAEIRLIR